MNTVKLRILARAIRRNPGPVLINLAGLVFAIGMISLAVAVVSFNSQHHHFGIALNVFFALFVGGGGVLGIFEMGSRLRDVTERALTPLARQESRYGVVTLVQFEADRQRQWERNPTLF